MPDQILKDVTDLGSKLANMAAQQLDDVLGELRGPIGGAPDAQSVSANLGRLAVTMLQMVGKMGTVVTELASYDLVHRGAPTLVLNSTNPLTDVSVSANEAFTYELLVDNNGRGTQNLVVAARLSSAGERDRSLRLSPALTSIGSLERRRVAIDVPALASPGRAAYTLVITVLNETGDSATVLAKKTVLINVLPAPEPPTPGRRRAKAKKKAKKRAKRAKKAK